MDGSVDDSSHRTLESVRDEIAALQRKHLRARVWSFFKDPGLIDGMRKQVEEAVLLFQVGFVVLAPELVLMICWAVVGLCDHHGIRRS